MENKEFVKLCQLMRGSSYIPPTRQRLSDELLPELFGALWGEFKVETMGRNVTLEVDGWKDIKNDPTLGFGVAHSGQEWLFKLDSTLGTPHTIANLGPLIMKVERCFLPKDLALHTLIHRKLAK